MPARARARRRALVTVAILLLGAPPLRAQAPTRADSASWAQWEPAIRAFEAQDRVSPPRRNAVLFVGSSSIFYWDSLGRDFPGVPVIKRGFGGSELGDVVHFMDRIVLPYAPRTIVLYAGDNDLANGKSPADVEEAFRRFAARVEQALPRTEIIFVAIKPSPSRWALADRIRDANARIERITVADARLSFADVFTPMIGADGHPRPALFKADSLHMTSAGYAVWVRVLGPYIH